MENITWSDKFRIGVEVIDLQHEYFILLINRLIVEMAESEDKYYTERLLEELSLYASFHFISEENIMLKNNYPGYTRHKNLHRKLINDLNDKLNRFKSSKEKEEEILLFLVNWFLEHTLKSDKELGLTISRKKSTFK